MANGDIQQVQQVNSNDDKATPILQEPDVVPETEAPVDKKAVKGKKEKKGGFFSKNKDKSNKKSAKEDKKQKEVKTPTKEEKTPTKEAMPEKTPAPQQNNMDAISNDSPLLKKHQMNVQDDSLQTPLTKMTDNL